MAPPPISCLNIALKAAGTLTRTAENTQQLSGAVASASEEASSNALGLEVESLSAEQRRDLGDPVGGVLISRVMGDAAYRAGLRPGDLILAINSQAIADVDEFEAVVKELPAQKAVALRVMRGGTTTFIAFTPDADE